MAILQVLYSIILNIFLILHLFVLNLKKKTFNNESLFYYVLAKAKLIFMISKTDYSPFLLINLTDSFIISFLAKIFQKLQLELFFNL